MYIAFVLLAFGGAALALLPLGGRTREPGVTEIIEAIKGNPEAMNTALFGQEPESEPETVLKNEETTSSEVQTESDTAIASTEETTTEAETEPETSLEGNTEPEETKETEPETTKAQTKAEKPKKETTRSETKETQKETEPKTTKATEAETTKAPEPETTTEAVTEEETTKAPETTPAETEKEKGIKIAKQYENRGDLSGDTISEIRSAIKSKVSGACGASYDKDLQYVAILRVQGAGGSAIEIIRNYNQLETGSLTWAECSAYTYISTVDEIDSAISSLCSNLSVKSNGCNSYGVGINVSTEDGFIKIRVCVVFVNQ